MPDKQIKSHATTMHELGQLLQDKIALFEALQEEGQAAVKDPNSSRFKEQNQQEVDRIATKLRALRKAQTIVMEDVCCPNDMNCNFQFQQTIE